MRRPVMYLAGLLLATGASLALAGPAQAAASHNDHHKCHHHNNDYRYDRDYDRYGNSFSYEDSHDQVTGLIAISHVLNGNSILGGL